VAGKDVKLFEGAQAALDAKSKMPGIKFAIASRTKSVDWAHDLLDQFEIRHLFDHIEIFPGNKRAHFKNIADASGVHYSDMLFFDDARDGTYGNCEPVSQMGVLSVHCPDGLHTEDIFENALERFREWDRSPNTIVEWNGKMTNTALSSTTSTTSDSRQEGKVKMVNSEKRFGFIRYGDRATKEVFFHFTNLPDNCVVEQGDKLSFLVQLDPKTGKERAANIEIDSSTATSKDTVNMRVFSMNMPFAALLANGYKTLETRNGTMFVPYPEGTQMLLHVGRRNYPDGNKHIDVMKSGGLSDDEIEKLKSLPAQGFGKGMAVAIVELGKTYETTVEERSDPEFQRRVAAFGSDSGKMVTEIKRVQYLKRPIHVSGQGGVFNAQIDPDVIPDGWLQPSAEQSYQVKNSDNSIAPASATSSTQSGSKPVYSISG
jgi:magnesium-dependent phosphatase 1